MRGLLLVLLVRCCEVVRVEQGFEGGEEGLVGDGEVVEEEACGPVWVGGWGEVVRVDCWVGF